jgi:hypothetical protein
VTFPVVEFSTPGQALRMKGWERDLLDHLVWLTLMYEEDGVSREEVGAELKREFPRLAADEEFSASGSA